MSKLSTGSRIRADTLDNWAGSGLTTTALRLSVSLTSGIIFNFLEGLDMFVSWTRAVCKYFHPELVGLE